MCVRELCSIKLTGFGMQFDVKFCLIRREKEQWVVLASQCDAFIRSYFIVGPPMLKMYYCMHEFSDKSDLQCVPFDF